MRLNGSPPPGLDFDEEHSFFMVRLPVHPKATGLIDSGREFEGAESGAESLEARILSLIEGELLSKSEIGDRLGKSSISGALNRVVKGLLERGLITEWSPR